MSATIVAVSRSSTHSFSKNLMPEIVLLAGLGVEGDAHSGATVRHRYRVRKDPSAPNLCQVHLLQQELFAELALQGIDVAPGQMGENVTTLGIDLIGLPRGARLFLGQDAIVEVTGLRDPCAQLDQLHPRLMKACISRNVGGELVRKAGIMGIVISGGVVRPDDKITIQLPEGPPLPLYPV